MSLIEFAFGTARFQCSSFYGQFAFDVKQVTVNKSSLVVNIGIVPERAVFSTAYDGQIRPGRDLEQGTVLTVQAVVGKGQCVTIQVGNGFSFILLTLLSVFVILIIDHPCRIRNNLTLSGVDGCLLTETYYVNEYNNS